MTGPLSSLRTRLGLGAQPDGDIDWPDRPGGRLIWVYVTDDSLDAPACQALCDLSDRLDAEGEPTRLLLTRTEDPPPIAPPGHLACAPPAESPAQVALFLQHFTPDWALWLGAGAPIAARTLCDAGWPCAAFIAALPGDDRATRAVLACCDPILTADPEIATALRTRHPDIPAQRFRSAGPLVPVTPPRTAPVAELDRLAEAMDSRPVWLAAMPRRDLFATLSKAQRQIAPHAQRLLMVLACDPSDTEFWAGALRSEGWHVSSRGAEAVPTGRCDIFLADDPDELGLWLRLCPVTVLCDTLPGKGQPGPALPDPLEAAALGTALIVGPAAGPNAQPLSQLAHAGALRRVHQASKLGAAVVDLLSPATAAQQAAAGWQVTSAGAPLQRALRLAAFDAFDRHHFADPD